MKTKSCWGTPPSRLYRFIRRLQSEDRQDCKVCVVGASDGKFVLPFLRRGFHVTAYEVDKVALFGGDKEFPIDRDHIQKMEYVPSDKNPEYQKVPSAKKEILGLVKRVEAEGYGHLFTLKEEDFYKNPPQDPYDIVFTSCSIPYEINFATPISIIMSVLLNCVSVHGYLYMDYIMPLEDSHDWRPEHYFRTGSVRKYFQNDCWKVIHLYEMSKPIFEAAHVDRPEDHFHRFGYILAKRLRI